MDRGPGEVIGSMRIEINTGYSCYLTAARRRRGRFFMDLGPGQWLADRDKHWVQLVFDNGSSSPGAVFFLVDLDPGAAVCCMRNADRNKHWVQLPKIQLG